MTTSDTIRHPADWPLIVDVLVQPSEGLWAFFVQTADETAVFDGQLDARSQRGALIELTAYMATNGFQPTERWDSDGDGSDALRRFRRVFPDDSTVVCPDCGGTGHVGGEP